MAAAADNNAGGIAQKTGQDAGNGADSSDGDAGGEAVTMMGALHDRDDDDDDDDGDHDDDDADDDDVGDHDDDDDDADDDADDDGHDRHRHHHDDGLLNGKSADVAGLAAAEAALWATVDQAFSCAAAGCETDGTSEQDRDRGTEGRQQQRG